MKIKGKQISNNTITESKLNLSKLTINSVTDNSVVLNIQGVNGQLFSIYDTLVGDLFTVSDISGMPILNVNSDENVDINGNLNLSGTLKNLNGDLIFTDSGGTYTLSEIINNPTIVVSSEASLRTSADISLSTGLSSEASLRTTADTSLSTSLTQRVSTDASLSTGLSSEASLRTTADTSLSTAISTETSTRIAEVSYYIPSSAASGLNVSTAKKLAKDNTIVNGTVGLQFAQYLGGDNPGGEWYSHLIMNHDNVNGYYIDLLSSFNSDVMYMRRKVNGVVSTDRRFMMYDDTASLSQLTVGTGSNTKVKISDGGYIGIDSINTNDNLILRAKGVGGLLLNYGSTGSHVGFYDGTTQIGYINATDTYFGNNLTINGSANINSSLTTAKLFDTSRKKQYVFENYTGGWVRIAKLSVPSTGEAVGTISIANTYGYSHSVSTTFSFGVTYRNIMPWVSQLGATNITLPKVRIVSPTNANTDYYIEVYHTAVGGPNSFYIQLSNEHNVELLNSFTNGEVPTGYVGREFIMNHYGISTNSILVGNNLGSAYNRIEVNDAGYLSLTTTGNELTIGKSQVNEGSLFINYRQPKTGTAPTIYIWNNGNTSEYADHRVGSLIANTIRFNSNYTTNSISGDGYGILFSGTQYVHFEQSGFNYFQSQIVARGGITNDDGDFINLNKKTKVLGLVEFKDKLQSVDKVTLGSNTAFQIRGVGESGVYASGIAFDTFNKESPESAYSYKERMRIFSNGNIAIGSVYDIDYKLVVSGSTYIEDGLVVNGSITVSSTTKVVNLNSDRVDGYHLWSGTQSQYDAIIPKDGNTIYFII